MEYPALGRLATHPPTLARVGALAAAAGGAAGFAMHHIHASRSGRRPRPHSAPRGVLGLFFVCCLYSVDVIKSAKGAYLEISASSKH